MLTNDICCYVDTSLMGQMDQWFLDGVTGSVITYDGRYDGAMNEDGSAAGGNSEPSGDDVNPSGDDVNP